MRPLVRVRRCGGTADATVMRSGYAESGKDAGKPLRCCVPPGARPAQASHFKRGPLRP